MRVERTRLIHRTALIFAALCFALTPAQPVQAQGRGQAGQKEALAKLDEAAALPTPKTPDGHPDLTGYWAPAVAMFGFDGKPFITATGGSEPGKALLGTNPPGNEVPEAQREANYDKTLDSRIQYKPEFRNVVEDNYLHPEKRDPWFRCEPQGVPRLGHADEIFSGPKAVVLLYENPFDGPDRVAYRVVPTDGRPHNPDADDMPMGDSVAHWEGDTLVIDVTHLSPKTWVFDAGHNGAGSVHDTNLHVIERYTRKGNSLEYSATVEDPTVFEKPFTTVPVRLLLNMDQHSHEDYPCVERDRSHMDGVTKSQ